MARPNLDHIDKLHEYGIYLPTRTVYIGTDEEEESSINPKTAKKAIKNIHILESISSDPINIILNSDGGEWYNGMAIYDKIKDSHCHITIKVYGQVMSMGTVILQGADERILSPNSRFMFHYGENGYYGQSKNFDRWAKENRVLNEIMESIYIKRIHEKQPAFSIQKLKGMLTHDTILSADEAVKLGLADRIEQEKVSEG